MNLIERIAGSVIMAIAAIATEAPAEEPGVSYADMTVSAAEHFTPEMGACLMRDDCALGFLRAFRVTMAANLALEALDGAHPRGDAADVIRHWYGQTMDADTQQSYAKITGILLNTSRE